MASKLEELEKEMLQLSVHERALLAKKLLSSLDNIDEKENDEEVEQAWFEEVENRYNDYEHKKTSGKPTKVVFKELREKFQ